MIQSAYHIDNDVVAYFPFNSQYETRMKGAVPTDVTFSSGKASFNGSSSYIDLGRQLFSSTNPSEKFSVKFTINTTDKSGTHVIIGQYLFEESLRFGIFLDTDGYVRYVKGGNDLIIGTIDIADGKDHEVIVTKAGSGTNQVKLYIDSVFDGEGTDNSSAYPMNTTLMDSQSDGVSRYLSGEIKGLVFYNRALDSLEISRLRWKTKYRPWSSGKLFIEYHGNSSLEGIPILDRNALRKDCDILAKLGLIDNLVLNIASYGALDITDSKVSKVLDVSPKRNNAAQSTGNYQPALAGDGVGFVFDAEDDYFNCGDIAGIEDINEFTVAVWIKSNNFNNSDTYGALVGEGAGSYDEKFVLYVQLTTQKFAFIVNTRGNSAGRVQVATSYVPYNDEGWHYLVGRYNGTHISLWVDAVKKDEAEQSGNVYDTGSIVEIGKQLTYYYKGSIDEVKIFNKALSQTEIETIFDDQKERYGL